MPSFTNGLLKLHVFGSGSKPGSSKNFEIENGSSIGTLGRELARRLGEVERSDDEKVRDEKSIQVRKEMARSIAKRMSKRRAEVLVVRSDAAREEAQAANNQTRPSIYCQVVVHDLLTFS